MVSWSCNLCIQENVSERKIFTIRWNRGWRLRRELKHPIGVELPLGFFMDCLSNLRYCQWQPSNKGMPMKGKRSLYCWGHEVGGDGAYKKMSPGMETGGGGGTVSQGLGSRITKFTRVGIDDSSHEMTRAQAQRCPQ